MGAWRAIKIGLFRRRRPRRASLHAGRALALRAGTALIATFAWGCDGCTNDDPPPAPSAAAPPGGLSRDQAGVVLARVGGRTITLAHYAAALERMDPLERIRYQTADRRQQLLDEMINVELLALEAERRGLDRRPETVELVREYQRDELLRRLRASLPKPSDLTAAEVSEYYRTHRDEFAEPEQRRAAHIVTPDEASARRALSEAQGSSPERWRELVMQHSRENASGASDKTTARPPIDVPGDLGMVSAAPESGGARVPEPVRAAVFAISEAGQVHPQVVAHAGRFHVVRLISKVEARQRTLSEVEEAIRARIIGERQASAKAELISKLRETTNVSIDESALERVSAPGSAAAGASSTAP